VLVAGEASGDMHGASLVTSLKELMPEIELSGIGGERLRAAGMNTLVDYREISAMGLVEVVGSLRKLARAYRQLARLLRQERPDLLILIDFPGFNLALARVAKRYKVPVFYYVSPQVWAWRRGRVNKIARRAERLAVVFPFEQAFYEGTKLAVDFVGHPLIDVVQITRGRTETLEAHGLDPARPAVVLMPGSRPGELSFLLPPLIDASRRLARVGPYQFAICLAPTFSKETVTAMLRSANVPVTLVAGDTYNMVAAAELALVASGTACLEVALVGTPMVIVYKLTWTTYLLARLLVRVPFIGMPNIIAGEEVVPELVQKRANGEEIAREALLILRSEEKRRSIRRGLRQVRRKLGAPGAARRAAAIVAEMLSSRSAE